MKRRKLSCPFCGYFWLYGVELNNFAEKIKIECYNPKCKEVFTLNAFKKVYLSRQMRGCDIKYKYLYHVMDKYSGVLNITNPENFSLEERLDAIKNTDIFVSAFRNVTAEILLDFILARKYDKSIYAIDFNRRYTYSKWIRHYTKGRIFTRIFEDRSSCFNRILQTEDICTKN